MCLKKGNGSRVQVSLADIPGLIGQLLSPITREVAEDPGGAGGVRAR